MRTTDDGQEVEDSEHTILGVASGGVTREQFVRWVGEHIKQI